MASWSIVSRGLLLFGVALFGGSLACSSTSITPRGTHTGGTAGAIPSGTAGATAGGNGAGGNGGAVANGGESKGGATSAAGFGGETTPGGAVPGGAATSGEADPGGAPLRGGEGPGGTTTGGGTAGGRSVAGGAGSGGTAAGGGGGAGGCLPADDPLIQGLHGCGEDLGEGRVRISYDFQTDDQLLDWYGNGEEVPDPVIDDQDRLVVATGTNPNIALFVRQMRVDALDYRVRLITGDHINVYVDTAWDNSWAPDFGIGCIQNVDGQGVVVDGIWDPSPTSNAVLAGNRYVGSVLVTDTRLTWTVNDIEHVRTYDSRTRLIYRNVAIGAYYSDVAFESVVLEGELAEP